MTYEQWKKDKREIRGYPNNNPDETLEILRKYYLFLKEYHFDLPKLKVRTIRSMSDCEGKKGNGAHCHPEKKQICFKPLFLRKRAGAMHFMGYDDERGKGIFPILRDTMAFAEILTHEIAHFRIGGCHNKRFYARQAQLFKTFINGVISGEIYK